MKSLFNLRELSNEEIKSILDDAMAFENGLQYDLSHKMIANLFFEPFNKNAVFFSSCTSEIKNAKYKF